MNTIQLLLMSGAAGHPLTDRRLAVAGLKIVLATDGSHDAAASCQVLQSLSFSSDSAIRVLSVVDGSRVPPTQVLGKLPELTHDHRCEAAEEFLRSAQASLSGAEVPVTARIRTGDPATEILREAEAFGAELVVVGAKGESGMRGFSVGTVARALVERCPCSVLVARPVRNDLREMIVATDGSWHGTRAVEFAARLPIPDTLWSTVIHVAHPREAVPQFCCQDREEYWRAAANLRRRQVSVGREVLAAATMSLSTRGRPARAVLCVGDPTGRILESAEKRQADLIIAGARGVLNGNSIRLGSVAERLLRQADCSVLIVR